MKYWWLENYKNLQIKMIPELLHDMDYFLVMLKNYVKIYEKIKDVEVDRLKEEELLINLYVLVSSKKIKDNRVLLLIQKLLDIPNNFLPISDYSLKEILKEIEGLRENLPIQEKLDFNNIAACYHCGQVFYVDKIQSVNKNGYCLCPYCGKHSLYFDNDYIPMNPSFLKLASLYYGISPLGCRYVNLKKMLRKNVSVTLGNVITTNTVIQNRKRKRKQTTILVDCSCMEKKKIGSLEESIILKNYYDSLMKVEDKMEYETTIMIENIAMDRVSFLTFLIILSIMEVLSKTVYLKNIKILCDSKELYEMLTYMIKVISH